MNNLNLETKICSKCHKKKPITEFGKGNDRFGLSYLCKECDSEKGKKYREENKEKRKESCKKWLKNNPEYEKKYREKNKEKIKLQCKRWQKDNLEKVKEKTKEYYKKNKEKIKAKNKKWSERNPGKVKKSRNKWYENNSEYNKEYYINNSEEIKENTKKYQQKNRWKIRGYKNERYKNDIIFRLNHNISGAIKQSLKGNKRGRKWETLVRYTLKDLKKHLEKQFRDGMTWENSDKWHIDHILPISKWNITSAECEDFKRCWALSNLQPLWEHDNLEKHNKILPEFAQIELYY